MEINLIREKIAKVLNININLVNAVDEQENLRKFDFNSIRLVELVVELENEFGIEFSDDDLLLESMDTIAKIKKLIEQRSIPG